MMQKKPLLYLMCTITLSGVHQTTNIMYAQNSLDAHVRGLSKNKDDEPSRPPIKYAWGIAGFVIGGCFDLGLTLLFKKLDAGRPVKTEPLICHFILPSFCAGMGAFFQNISHLPIHEQQEILDKTERFMNRIGRGY